MLYYCSLVCILAGMVMNQILSLLKIHHRLYEIRSTYEKDRAEKQPLEKFSEEIPLLSTIQD